MVSVRDMGLWVLKQGGEPYGSASGKGEIGLSTGFTLVSLGGGTVKRALPGPVAFGLGRRRVDPCEALPRSHSSRIRLPGARCQYQAQAFVVEIYLRIFQPGSTCISGIFSWVCREILFSNVWRVGEVGGGALKPQKPLPFTHLPRPQLGFFLEGPADQWPLFCPSAQRFWLPSSTNLVWGPTSPLKILAGGEWGRMPIA